MDYLTRLTKLPATLIASCCLVLLTSCSNPFAGKNEALKAVPEFHQLYNEGKVQQIYDGADAKLKGATSQKDFMEFMAAVQRKLGKVIQSDQAGYNVRSFNLTTTVVLNQNTTFEQGKGVETFTFEIEKGKAVLVSYNVNSKELVLK